MVIHAYDGHITDKERELPFCAVTVGESRPQATIHRPAGINDYQLLYTKSGVGRVRIREEEFEVREGDVFILPPFTPHEYSPTGEGWVTLWITYSGRAARLSFPFDSDVRRCDEFEGFYKKIKRGKSHANWRKDTSSQLYELLLCLSEKEGISEYDTDSRRPDISVAVQYIAEHYHETVELSRLAELAELSEGHFCRVFKQYTHMRPVEYITNLRIERAKDLLLKRPPLTVAEIARQTGFSSPAYFSKNFKEKTGKTPERYRKG